MPNKTPYEIRSDLLVLAQKICTDQAKAAASDGTYIAPTAQDIIQTAKELNAFVSSSPDKSH